MVLKTIQSNRMPTDGGVHRGGRGQRRIYCWIRRCTYRTGTSFLRIETFRRLFDGVHEYIVISFQSMIDDEAVARGRDLR